MKRRKLCTVCAWWPSDGNRPSNPPPPLPLWPGGQLRWCHPPRRGRSTLPRTPSPPCHDRPVALAKTYHAAWREAGGASVRVVARDCRRGFFSPYSFSEGPRPRRPCQHPWRCHARGRGLGRSTDAHLPAGPPRPPVWQRGGASTTAAVAPVAGANLPRPASPLLPLQVPRW